MQKRIIPILILLMCLALAGIVYVQYRWIDKAVTEKQALIDNNVYQAVNNIEQQLTDYRAMAFIGDTIFNDIGSPFIHSSAGSEMEQIIYRSQSDTAVNIEVKVMSSSDSDKWDKDEQVFQHRFESHFISEDDSLELEGIEEGLVQVESLLSRIKLEFLSEHDVRLDSAHVQELLIEEFELKGLGEVNNWGIWDNEKAEYVIYPKNAHTTDYDIPMFTTDVLEPGRYDLQITLNKSDLIWKEIWPMILLSILFIAIITIVFAYSIRLVIKHKKISQIKSDFINNMTHEFKTPLASISLAADSLIHPNTELTKENLEKYVAIIQSEKHKLNNQVERILEVAALSKDALDIPLELVNIMDIMTKAIKQFDLQIEGNKVEIDTSKLTDFTVKANAFHLEKVFVNLIENAIKYSEGKAKIAIISDPKNLSVSISDQGIGMDQKQLSKVFDNFYRAQTGDLHNTKGFGLGLSYAKLVIEKMGGTIELSSKVGSGTKASLKFNPS
ncbi:HAMP domain-containing histidine kinase [Paracrocinitomix mangrovi]|uniref:sensor histidine kinase n=1 Tax=Paracrocinitomix mangrovi TaxID=2862509 RepID=UPI001C8F0FFD|nr:HAMP domain-containing sensor histidine kinase [Paracrocinitomix mangrovi]UKN03242.1 HAMP domain-containing histidine kinase [Paracrocinitomix mangrovi]